MSIQILSFSLESKLLKEAQKDVSDIDDSLKKKKEFITVLNEKVSVGSWFQPVGSLKHV